MKIGYSIKGHDKHIKRFFFFVYKFANSVLGSDLSRGNLVDPCQHTDGAKEILE